MEIPRPSRARAGIGPNDRMGVSITKETHQQGGEGGRGEEFEYHEAGLREPSEKRGWARASNYLRNRATLSVNGLLGQADS